MLNYEEAVAYLNEHVGMGMKPGIERISGLLDMMGRPDAAYPVLHVAGTNGKTSVARMSTLLLVAHGLTTGTFTSPHLERVEERISVNGEIASPEQFAQAVADVKAFADIYEERHGPSLTYFELTAAMAFAWFADQAVDAAVVEVGLGGRFDATNAAHGAVSVLTSVGYDHMEYLGDTIEQIAGEKLAIVEDESVLVVGPVVEEVAKIARRKGAEKSATIFEYGKDYRVESATRAVGGWQVEIDGAYGRYENLYLPIHGRYQTINLAVAVAAVEGMMGRELDPEAVIDAASLVSSPGRMEPAGTDPLVLLDGAHNADGFSALGYSLREEFPSIKWVLVFGAMEDKEVESMIPALAPRLQSVVTTSIDATRAIDPEDLAGRVRPLLNVPVEVVPDQGQAVERARQLAGDEGAVLVAGSLYLVGSVRAFLKGEEAQPNERQL